MEKTNILCPHCGQRLAQLLGKVGQRQRLRALGGARVRTGKNALGEELGWIRCPKCKADKSINPAHWDAGS
jgi:DNA-directed RNA polymerase subunit RPC12/RpoP